MTHIFRRVTNITFALLLAVLSVNLSGVLGSASAHAATVTPTDGKITICHSHQPSHNQGGGLGPQDNPYNQATVAIDAVDGEGNNDHTSHTGVPDGEQTHVFHPGDLSWGDIIPAYPAGSYQKGNNIVDYPAYEGLNWTAEGQAIYSNGCVVPLQDATAGITVTPPTCDSASVATVTGPTNATLTSSGGVLVMTVGMHTATFTATAGHTFANYAPTLDVPYDIAAQLTGEQCAGPQPDDEKGTRVITNEPVCSPNGGGTVTSWTEERTRTYTYDSQLVQWVVGPWSDWTKVANSETTVPATDEECPTPEPCTPSMVSAITLATIVSNDNCPPGMGGGGGQPETPPAVVSTPAPLPTELPHTGPSESNVLAKLFTVVSAGLITYGAMFYLVNRRNLSKQ